MWQIRHRRKNCNPLGFPPWRVFRFTNPDDRGQLTAPHPSSPLPVALR